MITVCSAKMNYLGRLATSLGVENKIDVSDGRMKRLNTRLSCAKRPAWPRCQRKHKIWPAMWMRYLMESLLLWPGKVVIVWDKTTSVGQAKLQVNKNFPGSIGFIFFFCLLEEMMDCPNPKLAFIFVFQGTKCCNKFLVGKAIKEFWDYSYSHFYLFNHHNMVERMIICLRFLLVLETFSFVKKSLSILHQ